MGKPMPPSIKHPNMSKTMVSAVYYVSWRWDCAGDVIGQLLANHLILHHHGRHQASIPNITLEWIRAVWLKLWSVSEASFVVGFPFGHVEPDSPPWPPPAVMGALGRLGRASWCSPTTATPTAVRAATQLPGKEKDTWTAMQLGFFEIYLWKWPHGPRGIPSFWRNAAISMWDSIITPGFSL